ncbi:nickel-dependent lactate racemase, partial [Candidatus Bathyarchaeota archaeon]|nr:nickel-dependent lactate racemase [Candidatus Bathyarchaeota archaeon]
MVEVWLPYGRTEVCARIPTRNFLGLIEPREKPGVPNPHSEIERAMNEPIGAKRLSEIVKPGDKVAIVVDDAARPTASYLTVPSILNELNSAGVTDEYVTVIFACGTHREVEAMEMKRLVGDEVLNRVKIINHDCKSTDQVYIGTTSFGTKVCVNKVFAEADVRVLTGDVGLHYYAGYGGGRKSVLPGVSNAQSIQQNHAMLLHPKAEMGVL